jgi:D-aminoacyl-tRNA deacylase
MRLLVCSTEDVASKNIKARLMEEAAWTEKGEYAGSPVLRRGTDVMITIPELHLRADNIDQSAFQALGEKADTMVFLSRHRAESRIPTLTVHPIGNFGKADYGGREGTLVPAAPDLMTSLLRTLTREAKGLPFQVGLEVTHHGPYLETPTLFIEIGSSEDTWGNEDAARAVAHALLNVEVLEAPIAVGVGGGHYAPRFTEASLGKKVSFGHMIPNHVADPADDATMSRLLSMALQMSASAKLVYIHKKSMQRSRATHLKDLVRSLGAEPVDSSDLADL